MFRLLSCFLTMYNFFAYGQTGATNQTYSESGPRSKFENTFNRTCSKYPFVSEYLANLEKPSRRYVIFYFDGAGVNNGGLGDRLAGLVTAFAFALRTRRTLLISGDRALNEAFEPYHPNNNGRFKWGDWSWSGWTKEEIKSHPRDCVKMEESPKCHLDDDIPDRVIRYISNRSYLCRWTVRPELYEKSNLARLGITNDTDLFEAAGCMLRLVLWPTKKLWKALDDSLESSLSNRESSVISYQVGFHFRCGDFSFNKHKSACYYDSSVKWRGTMHRQSMESPRDLGNCGKQILNNLSPGLQKNAMAFIASDNQDSTEQINTTMNWPFVIVPEGACHISLDPNSECPMRTLVHWFILALSDEIVIQGLNAPALSLQSVPSSGFSRFAAIYALQKEAPAYGLTCTHGNKAVLSKQTQGNWLCNHYY